MVKRRRDWRTILWQDAPYALIFVAIVALSWAAYLFCDIWRRS